MFNEEQEQPEEQEQSEDDMENETMCADYIDKELDGMMVRTILWKLNNFKNVEYDANESDKEKDSDEEIYETATPIGKSWYKSTLSYNKRTFHWRKLIILKAGSASIPVLPPNIDPKHSATVAATMAQLNSMPTEKLIHMCTLGMHCNVEYAQIYFSWV